jgi:hypothetical protein
LVSVWSGNPANTLRSRVSFALVEELNGTCKKA